MLFKFSVPIIFLLFRGNNVIAHIQKTLKLVGN